MQCSASVGHIGLNEEGDVCRCTGISDHPILPHVCEHGWTWTGDDDIAPPKTSKVDWENEVEDTNTWEDFLSGISHRDKEVEVDLAMIISAGVDKEGEPFTNVDGYGEGPHHILTQIGLLENALRLTKDMAHGTVNDNDVSL